MTPEEQRETIAKACGWKKHGPPQVEWAPWKHPDYVAPHDPRPEMKGHYGVENPPDYFHDANASAEMRKHLTHDEWPKFAQRVLRLILRQPVTTEKANWFECFMICDASPDIQADAFLWVKSLWREQNPATTP